MTPNFDYTTINLNALCAMPEVASYENIQKLMDMKAECLHQILENKIKFVEINGIKFKIERVV